MKNRLVALTLATVFVIAGCGKNENNVNYKSISIDDDVVNEYMLGDSFEKPTVYGIDENGNKKVLNNKNLSFDGYDLSKSGKQTINISANLKSDGKGKNFTASYDIFVFEYDALPEHFKNAQKTIRHIIKTIYDFDDNTKLVNYSYSSNEEEHLKFEGDAEIPADVEFTTLLTNIDKTFKEDFIQIKYTSVGLVEDKYTGYNINYVDSSKTFDIEMFFVNRGESYSFEMYVYKTQYLTEWPSYTVQTITSWITANEENVPAVEGDMYSFKVTDFSIMGIATVNTYTMEDPTEAYEEKLIKAGYKLFELPTEYTTFFNKIAVTSDGELAFEYGYEGGMFTLGFFKAQIYEFDVDKAANLIHLLNRKSTTVIPVFNGGIIYQYFPELISYAGVAAFRVYSQAKSLNSLLEQYKSTLSSSNWTSMNEGKPDLEGGYDYLAPNKDIRMNIVIDNKLNAIEVKIYNFKSAEDGWPTNEIKALLPSTCNVEVPEYEGGNATSYETYDSTYYKGIIVYVGYGNEDNSLNSYINTITKAGFVYDEEATKDKFNSCYTSIDGVLTLCVFTLGDGTFTIELYCNVEELTEVIFARFLNELEMLNNEAISWVNACAGNFVSYSMKSSSNGDEFTGIVKGDIRSYIEAFAITQGCIWYEEQSLWGNQETYFEIDVAYDAESNTTSFYILHPFVY